MNKHLDDLRKKDIAELQKLLKEAKVNCADELLKFRLGKIKVETSKKNRVGIAQLMTVLKEKEILNG